MVGSFEVFRKYQRSLLVLVAILAMLAFFVLPPFLQMGSSTGGQDPVAVSWKGGSLREADLERIVALRSLVNRFLVESAEAAGRDPSRMPLLPEGEEQTVQTLLLAQDAKANGIAVSDRAINDFLGQWTGNLVRQEQFDEILARLRLGPLPLTQQDLFEALRTELSARSMLMLHQSALMADPPGWQWDAFRQLEQRATVEVVPVVVENFSSQVPAPADAALRAFFDKYKEDLPQARSADPGFREPHRVQYEYLVAKPGAFEEEEAKGVTDATVAEYYEKNKATMFRAKPAETKPADADEKKPETKPADEAKPEAKPEPKPEPKPEAERKPAASTMRMRVSQVSFRQPSGDAAQPATAAPETPAKTAEGVAKEAVKQVTPEPAKADTATQAEVKPAEVKAAADTAVKTSAEPKADAAAKPGDANDEVKKDAAAAEDPAQFEPLEKVKDDIRKRLARERADARIDAIFNAVAGDLGRYAEDYALWQARRPAGVEAPRPPDAATIAKTQGLESGRSEPIAADAAFSSGGIGGSFEFVPDPTSRFGIRQQRWLDQMFGTGGLSLRPIRSRDVEGNRYLSWKTVDQPEFTPTFEEAKPGVERAWRIVEGRGLARKKAEEIARAAEGKTEPLAAIVAGTEAGKPETGKLEAVTVGPFSWLSMGGMAMGGGAPVLSQPEGLSMPGDDFMRTVFALEPGRTGVAFNEPKTVCYVIRLVSLEPPAADLQERFVSPRGERQRVGAVAQRDAMRMFRDMLEGLQKRHGLEWKRPIRIAGR